MQEILRLVINRIQGGIEGFLAGDGEAGFPHHLDALAESLDGYAELEARRWAAAKNNDALLKRRATIQANSGSTSVAEVMYSLAKEDATQESFFRAGGSKGHNPVCPSPCDVGHQTQLADDGSQMPQDSSLKIQKKGKKYWRIRRNGKDNKG